MSEDLNKRKSDYLLKLALEERLEQDPDMVKYQNAETAKHTFSKEHNRRMKKPSACRSRDFLWKSKKNPR